MLQSSIGWILVISGIPTAAAGLAALLFPRPVLGLLFRSSDPSSVMIFFVRHWGALLFVICALTVYAGFFPASRGPILTAAAIEKVIIFALIFFGELKRTPPMAAIAIMDGLLAIVFTLYLLGVGA
jgi:hypothetical protein